MLQNTLEKNLQYIVNILFFMLLLLPVPVLANSPVDITVGATYSFPWNVSALKPGSSGTASIDLINNGTLIGTLSIWVANISQTDAFGDGAALGNYMYFNISHPRLVSTLPLPARIGDFPATPMMGKYLGIRPVRPGETITLIWTWEFVETGQLQNDAQGDTLRFDINYMLVNGTPPLPTVTPTSPPRSRGSGSTHLPEVDWSSTPAPHDCHPDEEITDTDTPLPYGSPTLSPDIQKRFPFGFEYWWLLIIVFLIITGILIMNRQRKRP